MATVELNYCHFDFTYDKILSVTAPSVNIFKKRLEEACAEVFPHLPH